MAKSGSGSWSHKDLNSTEGVNIKDEVNVKEEEDDQEESSSSTAVEPRWEVPQIWLFMVIFCFGCGHLWSLSFLV